MNQLASIGRYFLFLLRVFRKPEKHSYYYRQTMKEFINLGVNSMGIVAVISVFMGSAIALQTAYNTGNPLYPKYFVGVACRDSIILEFSSTVVALILAGKIGSQIASQIGTMRVSEQIDALDIMGVNTESFLVLPKLTATMIFNPFLTMISMMMGIFGGWLAVVSTGVLTSQDFIYGIQYAFHPNYVSYSLVKTVVFAFIITTVSAFYGYHVKGGSLEVGKASTQSVVFSCVYILLFNIILTQTLLS